VHLRRALLLFAIVLGMAALVASLSRPIEPRRTDTAPREPGPPKATPGPAPELRSPLAFVATENSAKRLRTGEAATIEVTVPERGSVEIPNLGLTAPADRFTPARFEVLPTRPGRYPLVFTPSNGDRSRPAGRLVVTSEG
jgi:hypothetical protein